VGGAGEGAFCDNHVDLFGAGGFSGFIDNEGFRSTSTM